MTNKPSKISLFLPCLADMYYPSIGRSVIRLLQRAGYRVDYPEDQTCCGQWAVNMGRPDAAEAMARHFIRVFRSAETVVCPSASCVMTVREYPGLLKEPDWKAEAEALGKRVFELTDFLVNQAGAVDIGVRLTGRATLHDSCHPLRGLGLKAEPRALLEAAAGLDIVEMADPEICCGFGGAFMGKFASLSKTMADQKIDQALDTGADWLVMTEPGCLLNVDSALRARDVKLRAIHLADLLARGLEGAHG